MAGGKLKFAQINRE